MFRFAFYHRKFEFKKLCFLSHAHYFSSLGFSHCTEHGKFEDQSKPQHNTNTDTNARTHTNTDAKERNLSSWLKIIYQSSWYSSQPY